MNLFRTDVAVELLRHFFSSQYYLLISCSRWGLSVVKGKWRLFASPNLQLKAVKVMNLSEEQSVFDS